MPPGCVRSRLRDAIRFADVQRPGLVAGGVVSTPHFLFSSGTSVTFKIGCVNVVLMWQYLRRVRDKVKIIQCAVFFLPQTGIEDLGRAVAERIALDEVEPRASHHPAAQGAPPTLLGRQTTGWEYD